MIVIAYFYNLVDNEVFLSNFELHLRKLCYYSEIAMTGKRDKHNELERNIENKEYVSKIYLNLIV